MPLDVEIFYPYWQETWNLIFLGTFTQTSSGGYKNRKKLKVNPYSKAKLPKWVVAGWILLNSYCIKVRF